MVQDSIPPTPVPAPTRVHLRLSRAGPPTGLLRGPRPPARACCASRTAPDGDGDVILVTVPGDPVQAAYIRAGDTYEMAQFRTAAIACTSQGQGLERRVPAVTAERHPAALRRHTNVRRPERRLRGDALRCGRRETRRRKTCRLGSSPGCRREGKPRARGEVNLPRLVACLPGRARHHLHGREVYR